MSNERACANTPVLSRRSTLAGMAASCAAAPSIISAAQVESPIMTLFREHQAYQDWMNDLPLTWTDEDMEPHYQHLLKLEREIMALPSRNAADFAAKSIVQNFDILTPDEWENAKIWQEARLLTT